MSSGDPRVILQDLLEFTVMIRHPGTAAVLGTGVLVSPEGIIVTCAHVLANHQLDPALPGIEVQVYLPARDDRPAHVDRAQVIWAATDGYSDDLVCLRTARPVPVPAEKVAVLGTSARSRDHRFQSFGFRVLDRYPGGLAQGTILGRVLPPEQARVHADPVQLKCSDINAGMSGAPVLDLERNLVVGVVAQTWYADQSLKDRDTAWAVDAKVLQFTGLGLPLQFEALTLQHAERPNYDRTLVRRAVPAPGHRLEDAPMPLEDWVGRQAQLDELDDAAHEERRLVIALVGLGGEGKSSLARRWVDDLLDRDGGVAGVFWWSCTERANTEEFLDAAIEFMSGGQIDPAKAAEGGGRPAVAFGMMAKRRYLIILDGLEVMQHQRGDRYAGLASAELRDFLQYAATPGSQSLVLLTSRLPVLDLAAYLTYRQVVVGALSREEGRHLLQLLGVVGSDAALDQVVDDWDGHALTLSLIGTYLKRRHGGDVRRIATLPPPQPNELRDAQVRRILAEYDQVLSAAERIVLQRISIFRTPVEPDAVRAVLRGATDVPDWAALQSTTMRYLLISRIVRRDSAGRYTMHPLVRDFYARQADDDVQLRRRLHELVKEHYLRNTAQSPAVPALDDLVPIIEAVHHAAASGAYDEACEILYDRVYLGDRGLITRELNAYETVLSILLDLFPDRDMWAEPLVTDRESRAWVLHEVATCLQLLGRLRDAAAMFRRAIPAMRELNAHLDAAVGVQNLAELFLELGALPACRSLVAEAFSLAPENSEDELVAETLQGGLAHLEGRSEQADHAFANAIRIAREVTPVPALYSASGVRYAEHLRRSGRLAEAERVHRLNLKICQAAKWRADVAHCLVGLGDLALDQSDFKQARERLDEAVRIAKGITRRDVLVAALRARGALALRIGQPKEARTHLDQARSLAELGGYRLAEVDTLIQLGQLHYSAGDTDMARDALNEAEQISIEIGYHWGSIDAAVVRSRLTI
ncbi:tetratricopeptide repeat protein [Micromonospora sp. U21]|uniref:tetratricopeptide repeat protein n=1 Tax=Micromonospora sp. U21 TaxID=2824899 RepID=UPI001B35AC89|nr:tetratricopeptide repeat protein [Micromonospora sp. U21]MBQ0906798.1 tetratricopeptide repeat protein [Micromonospora sp. U21]